ncbi:MAG: hypothetical protein WC348_04275 [Patescibacteria group bacterium]|jgi:hypothetical protein
MNEVSKDLMREKQEQVEGLKRLFEKLFGEYFEKHREYPPLRSGDLVEDTRRVNQFIGSRPEIMRSIQGLPSVQNIVVETALDVLEKLARK